MAPSSLQWLDFSEHERRKANEVIALFQEQDTRDELGIAMVRDAFAELLFPGTGTMQTRVAYFLFIPWMYLDLESRRVASSEIAARARSIELRLIDVLASSPDGSGTIGVQARRLLQRLPSSIYWQGLHVWGIRLPPGSQDTYHRSLDACYTVERRNGRNDDGEPIDGTVRRNWHRSLPSSPAVFPKEATFRLRQEDAEYLREQVLGRMPTSLLAFLLDHPHGAASVDFPWLHPHLEEFPTRLREELHHARSFAEVMHGAALLYNLMLAETARRDSRIEEYRQALARWHQEIDARQSTLASWDRQRLWTIVLHTGARITPQTRAFIDMWMDLVLSGPGVDDARARDLIRAREVTLKRGQARLENPRALERWGGASGTRRLNYRWPVATTMITDLQVGLAARGERA